MNLSSNPDTWYIRTYIDTAMVKISSDPLRRSHTCGHFCIIYFLIAKSRSSCGHYGLFDVQTYDTATFLKE